MNKFFTGQYLLLVIYLLFINILNLILFKIDKKRAHFKRWRISEKTFLFLSLIGGSLGGLVGMNYYRHKNRKTLFRALLVLAFILNFISLIYILKVIEGLDIRLPPGMQIF